MCNILFCVQDVIVVLAQQSESSRWIQCSTRFQFEGGWSGVVCTPSAPFQRHPLPSGRKATLTRPQGGVPGLFQHIRAYQSDPEQRHATGKCAHVIQHCQQPAFALPIHLPGGQCTGTSPPHPLLHRQQNPSNYSLQIQGHQTPWFSVCRYPEGSLEWQQTLRGESYPKLWYHITQGSRCKAQLLRPLNPEVTGRLSSLDSAMTLRPGCLQWRHCQWHSHSDRTPTRTMDSTTSIPTVYTLV